MWTNQKILNNQLIIMILLSPSTLITTSSSLITSIIQEHSNRAIWAPINRIRELIRSDSKEI
jgi:hypothetical protein